jgi:hypothetical protein
MSGTKSSLSKQRKTLCSIENANRVAAQTADTAHSNIAVVKTCHPLQPFRVVLANCAPHEDLVTLVTIE